MTQRCRIHYEVNMIPTSDRVGECRGATPLCRSLRRNNRRPGYVSAVAGVGWVNGRDIRGVRARTGTINNKPTTMLADIAS